VFFVVSDDHKGLTRVAQKNLQGALSRYLLRRLRVQRCQVHLMPNFLGGSLFEVQG